MLLRIETWATELRLPEEAQIAIFESARCHKAGAYRAALLFAYLGWGLTLRTRILEAQCPTGIPPGRWVSLQTALQNEDRWDAQVFDCTQTQPPAAIFVVSDDLRLQVKYWKDRRNDCAHFKKNQILAAHVETFWAFMESNLGKFVPNGSSADLLARIERHFDRNVTPPNSDITPIVRLIHSSVPAAELPAFVASIPSVLVQDMGFFNAPRISEISEVFEAIFTSAHSDVLKVLVSFLGADPALLAEFVRRHPERLISFSGLPSTIRQLWRKELFSRSRADLHVMAALLRNNLIPQAELSEAVSRTAQVLNGDIPLPHDLPVLRQAGWIDELRRYAFDENMIDKFAWSNRNAATIQWLLAHEPITPAMAAGLCQTFASEPFPHATRDVLQTFFQGDIAKRTEFLAMAAQAGMTPPKTLL